MLLFIRQIYQYGFVPFLTMDKMVTDNFPSCSTHPSGIVDAALTKTAGSFSVSLRHK